MARRTLKKILRLISLFCPLYPFGPLGLIGIFYLSNFGELYRLLGSFAIYALLGGPLGLIALFAPSQSYHPSQYNKAYAGIFSYGIRLDLYIAVCESIASPDFIKKFPQFTFEKNSIKSQLTKATQTNKPSFQMKGIKYALEFSLCVLNILLQKLNLDF